MEWASVSSARQPPPISLQGTSPELSEKSAWRCDKCATLFDGGAIPLAEEQRWRNMTRGLEAALAAPEQNAKKLAPLRRSPEVLNGDASIET